MRTLRVVDMWQKIIALETAKRAASMPDGREKRDLIEKAWAAWQAAHGREVRS